MFEKYIHYKKARINETVSIEFINNQHVAAYYFSRLKFNFVSSFGILFYSELFEVCCLSATSYPRVTSQPKVIGHFLLHCENCGYCKTRCCQATLIIGAPTLSLVKRPCLLYYPGSHWVTIFYF